MAPKIFPKNRFFASLPAEIPFWILLGTLAKLFLWFGIPLLDDEAYFIQWSYTPDYGYYDHAPMVGWINALMGLVIDDYRWYRLLPFVTSVVTTSLLWRCLRRAGATRAALVASIYWISLASLLHFATLNDTCLVLFCSLSMYFLKRYLDRPRVRDALLTGVFWGAAFLSKYLAVLMAPGFLIALLWKRRDKTLSFVGWVSLTVLPLAAINIAWNYNNCWNNILFNIVTRHSVPDGFQTHTYLLTLLALMGPLMTWYVARAITSRETLRRAGLGLLLGAGPLIAFLYMSHDKLIGAHWILPFIVPIYASLAALDESSLRRLLRFSGWYSGIVVLGIVGATLFSDAIVTRVVDPSSPRFTSYLYFTRPREVCSLLDETIPADTPRFSNAYSIAALLQHHCGRPVCAAFRLGRHGRQSDKDCDMRALDGQNAAVIMENDRVGDIRRYFRSGEIRRLPLRGGNVIVFLGQGFDLNAYRQNFLSRVRRQYYARPSWLPNGRCPFDERYFPNSPAEVIP